MNLFSVAFAASWIAILVVVLVGVGAVGASEGAARNG